MDAFFLAAQVALPTWLLIIGCTALVLWVLCGSPVPERLARQGDAEYPEPQDVVTQAELLDLLRKVDENRRRNEARISSLERTMTNQLHEMNRSLGRIEGKIEKL